MKLLKRAKEKMFFDDILQRLKFDVHVNSNTLEKKTWNMPLSYCNRIVEFAWISQEIYNFHFVRSLVIFENFICINYTSVSINYHSKK